jgi:energy-coupling factor transport system permease protein
MQQRSYIAIDSVLHRLNPLTKLMMTFPLVLFVALTTDPWTPGCFILLSSLLVLLVGRIPIGRYLRIALPTLLLLCSFLLTYPLLVNRSLVAHSPLLWQAGPIKLYQAALWLSVSTTLRIFALLMLSLPFTLTTEASDFIRALVQQWHVPYKIGYGVIAAFRFVPLLQSEVRMIQAAHTIRGISERGGPIAQYDRFKRYFVPLMATAIRRAERTALAMDGRAFGSKATRTSFHVMAFHARDFWWSLAWWTLCLLVVIGLWHARLLGPLVLFQPS